MCRRSRRARGRARRTAPRAASRRRRRPGGPPAPAARPRPGPGARPPRATRTPSGAVDLGGVERPDRHAGLDQREEQRVVEQVVATEPAVHEAVEHGRLGRRAVGVGVEADVAEEDAVGPRDRLLALGDGLGAAEAAARGTRRRSLHRPRRAPGPRVDGAARTGAAPGTRRATSASTQPGARARSSRRPPAPLLGSGDELAQRGLELRLVEQPERRALRTSPPG